MKKTSVVLLPLLALSFAFVTAFNLDNAIVPRDEILSGGPPKDGIPALLHPKFTPADQAGYLEPSDAVVGVVIEGRAWAYPLKILVWHEVVNDTLAGRPIVVTF